MRNWIIGAAAALAVVAAPSVAAANGYVGVVYSNSDFGGGDDVESWGAEGAVAFAGSGSIVFEVDAAINTTDDTTGDDETGYGLVGHLYARNSDHLFGGFVGIAGSEDTETWLAGLEASKFFSQWTLAGAAFYGNNDDFDTDGFGLNVEGRVFLNDNFRLNGNVGWVSTDSDTFGDEDAMLYGVGGEFQFATFPVSIGAGWSTIDFDGGDVDTWTIGARWNFGGQTLMDRDRNGASQASVIGLANAF